MRARRSKKEVPGGSGAFPDASIPKKIMPIWLGSGTREEPVHVRGIKEIVPEELRQHEAVLAIERLESGVFPCEVQKKFITAAECLEQAINLRRKLLGDAHQDLLTAVERYVVSCNIWGVQCLGAGQYTCSLELLTKAEATTEADNVPNFKRRIALRAATFNNLCCYFRHRGKLNAALQYAERALKIEQKYKDAEDPARTHLNYAVLLSMVNRHEDALEHIESAIAMLHNEETNIEASSGTSSGDVGSAWIMQRQEDIAYILVVAYYNMWVELTRLSQKEAALDCIIRAANIAKRKLGPEHMLTVKMEETLSSVQAPLQPHDNLAEIYAADRATALPPELTPRQLPPLEAQAAWQAAQALKKHGDDPLAVLADAQVIKLRKGLKEPPHPPPGHPDERRSPFKKSLHRLKIRIVRKTNGQAEILQTKPQTPATPALVADLRDPLFETRPKLESLSKKLGFAGSPAMQQQAYGVQPMASARPRTAAPDLTPPGAPPSSVSPRPLAPLEPKTQAEAPVARELRAVYEYHWKQVQQRMSSDGTEAEVSSAPSRLKAISVFRSRLDERRERGLPTASESNRQSAAMKLQAAFRGYMVRLWSAEELARESKRRREIPAPPTGTSTMVPTTRAGSPSGSASVDENEADGTMTPQGPPDMKRRIAFRVIYAARRAFLEHSAAQKIQRTWRGWATRRDIQEHVEDVAHATATKLQAHWRRYNTVARANWRASAAIVIQTTCRGWLARQLRKRRQRAARLLTRVVVGYGARKRLRRRQQAALPLQHAFRGFSARRRFRRCRLGALAFQKEFRGLRCRRRYARQRTAATRIEALWRGYSVRRDQKLKHEVAALIQRRFRIHSLQRKDKRRARAVSKIGAVWQGRLARRLRPYRSSACRIQASMRGFLLRKRLRQWPSAALRIQVAWRGHVARHQLKVKVALAIALQKIARRHLMESELRHVEFATVLCQSRVRGNRCREQVRQLHAQATRIQAWWRSARCYWSLVRVAVLAQRIQAAWRRWSAHRRFRELRAAATAVSGGRRGVAGKRRLCLVRKAAVRLQAVCRGHLCRQRLRRERGAAICIQRSWRQRSLQQEALRRSRAATRIQAAFRGHLRKDRFLALRFSIVGLQKVRRGHLAKRRYTQKRRLAIALQAAWRSRAWRKELSRQHRASLILQCAWRCHLRQARVELENRSADKLQAIVLGYLARKKVRRQHEAAVVITRFVRLKRQNAHAWRHAAAHKIAAWVRAKFGKRHHYRRRQAAIVLQKNFRTFIARRRFSRLWPGFDMLKCRYRWKKRLRCVKLIHCAWRRFKVYKRLRAMKSSALTIQRVCRGLLSNRRLARLHKAATLIQAHARRRLASRRWIATLMLQKVGSCEIRRRRSAQFTFKHRQDPVKKLEAAIKSWLVRKRTQKMQAMATFVARLARGYLTRKHLWYLNGQAPIPIQRVFKRRRAKVRVERIRWQAHQEEIQQKAFQEQLAERRQSKAILRIQAFWRMWMQRRWYRHMLASDLPRIQAFCRMINVQKAMERRTRHVVTLQKYARAVCRLKFRRQKQAVVTIQRAYRRRLLRSPEFCDIFRVCTAVRKLQAAWRCHMAYWRHLRRRVATVRLQAYAKGLLGRRRYLEKRAAAKTIQVSFVKICLARKQVRRRSEAKLRLQAFGRSLLVRQRLRRQHAAAGKIQAAWRRTLSRDRFQRKNGAAMQLQAFLRMQVQCVNRHPARLRFHRLLHACALGWFVRSSLRRKRSAATQIQRAYRRHRCLRRYAAAQQIARILQRVWRGRRSRLQTLPARRRLQRVPAHARGFTWRKDRQPQRAAAAVAIQRVARGHLARRGLQRKANAASLLAAFRRMQPVRQRHLRKCAAALQIQAFWRMRVERRKYLDLQRRFGRCGTVSAMRRPIRYRLKCRAAAVTIQSGVRGFWDRRRFRRVWAAALTIQRFTRGCLARCRVDRRRRAIAKIQAVLDGAYQRRRLPVVRARSVRLQAFVRARHARGRFLELRSAQIRIAWFWRGLAVRRRWRRQRAASIRLEAAWRCFLGRRGYRRKRDAARCIQAAYRSHLARLAAAKAQACALRLQSTWRKRRPRLRHLDMQRAAEVIVRGFRMFRLMRLRRRRVAAATRIAALGRGHCVRLHSRRREAAARRLQRWWFGVKALRAWRSEFAPAIQGLVEAKLRREAFFSFHACVIQHCFRSSLARPTGLTRLRRAVICLQAHARRRQASRVVARLRAQVRLSRQPSKKAVLLPDAQGRLTKARTAGLEDDHGVLPVVQIADIDAMSERQREQVAATIAPLQSFVKSRLYLKRVVTIQRRWRGYFTRQVLRRKHRKAMHMQAVVRGMLQRKHFVEGIDDVYKLPPLMRLAHHKPREEAM